MLGTCRNPDPNLYVYPFVVIRNGWAKWTSSPVAEPLLRTTAIHRRDDLWHGVPSVWLVFELVEEALNLAYMSPARASTDGEFLRPTLASP
jgi:hypothetical protein